MFESDKTILGNRTSFDIDFNNKEKLVYNYELKKRLLEIFIYGDIYTIRKEDAIALNISDSLKSYNNSLFIVDKQFLDDIISSRLDIEIKYVKDGKD